MIDDRFFAEDMKRRAAAHERAMAQLRELRNLRERNAKLVEAMQEVAETTLSDNGYRALAEIQRIAREALSDNGGCGA